MQHQDTIDIRDIIERVEALREEFQDMLDAAKDRRQVQEFIGALLADTETTGEIYDLAEELDSLETLLQKLEGGGGDEQWEGNWYPATLIHEDYFTQYAQELAEDCGMVGKNDKWPYTCIDWDAAAEELKHDYSTVEFDGSTYYYR